MTSFRFLISVAFIALSTVCQAQNVDEATARDTGIGFLNAKKTENVSLNAVNKLPAYNDYELAYTASKGSKVCFYVYNCSAGGFVIVSADERTEKPVLGYSTEGSFDYERLPINAKGLIDGYAKQIFKADSCGYEKFSKLSTLPTRSAKFVEPLLKTQWGQGYPYNILCPKIGDDHCVTGCVPTAIAQVMKYNRWPEHGSGVFYMPDNNQQVDISQSSYDWDIMSNNYDVTAATQESKNAVATIMRDVGLASESEYGLSATSTWTQNAAIALVENFDYDRSIQLIARDYISNEDWIYELKSELDEGWPCINDGGSHCFVCDGYDKDDYFHYNFGWRGYEDGYYLPEAVLDYSEGQTLIKRIRKNFGGKPWHQAYSKGDMVWNDGEIFFSECFISAPGIEDVHNYALSLMIENEESGEIIVPEIKGNFVSKVYYTSLATMSDWDFFDGFWNSEIKNGKYKVYLCTVNKRDVRDINKVLFPDNAQSYITLIVNDNEKTFINHLINTPDGGRIYHNGLYYILDSEGKTAAVSNKSDKSPCYIGDITIPESINFDGIEYSITSINKIAFAGCNNLTSVFIPKSIESIDTSAFAASGLKNIIFEENSNLKEIDYCAFYNCEYLADIILPDGISKIEGAAFGNCWELTKINIPSSVESIGERAFYIDNGILTDVTVNWETPRNFPNAFLWGDYPVTLHVPVGTSEAYKNMDCWNKFNILEGDWIKAEIDGLYYDVNLPDKTAKVSGFDAALNIKDAINIPNSIVIDDIECKVVEIVSNSFKFCKFKHIIIPANVEIIGPFAFSYNQIRTAELESGSKLKMLCDGAFAGSNLETIELPDGLTVIGENCFWHTSLRSIEIPESVERIGAFAFPYEFDTFKAINVNWKNPKDLGYLTGEDRPDLIMYVPYETKASYEALPCWNFLTIEEGKFSFMHTDIDGISYAIAYPDLEATVIPKSNGEYSGDITIPNSVEYNGDIIPVKSIGAYAFEGCSLNDVILPQNIETVQRGAFRESEMSSIKFLAPSRLIYIENQAFHFTQIPSIEFPASLEKIGTEAFAQTPITEINIPNSVREFYGAYHFAASAIKSVSVNWDEPLHCTSTVFHYIGEDDSDKILYVPVGTKEKYAQVMPWSKFGEIVEDENLSVDNIYMGDDNITHNIYNVSGILVKRNASQADIENLPSGFYIIDGRKVSVK